MKSLTFVFLWVSACAFLIGCKGTGILMMPSKNDQVNQKFKCSSAFLNGYWIGKYGKSKVEIDVKPGKNKDNPCSVDIWIYDKDKKEPLIPMKMIAFQVKEDKYVLFVADIEKIVKQSDYSVFSTLFLYPVMKIFKITQPEPGKLSFQEVIFTRKEGKDKIVKLDAAMNMWGENSNMIYGSSTEIISYLEKGKYSLSDNNVLTKRIEATEKPVEAKKK